MIKTPRTRIKLLISNPTFPNKSRYNTTACIAKHVIEDRFRRCPLMSPMKRGDISVEKAMQVSAIANVPFFVYQNAIVVIRFRLLFVGVRTIYSICNKVYEVVGTELAING